MRKKKLATYAVALALAAVAMTGVTTQTAHAEEAVQVVATETDAAGIQETEATVEPQTAEAATDVEVDKVTVAEGGDAYYNININGGTWDGNQYVLDNGQTIINAFFCDGTYTYYLQADGTPMKDRLTYHPDGIHIIYFDANGHEVFSDFANVKKSIAGDPVDDMCFFDTYGYMYVNQLTFDKSGQKIYFINECGVIEKGKWTFVNDAKYFDQDKPAFGYVYAQEDGTLLRNTFTYWNGNLVYLQGEGFVASDLWQVDGMYYLLDAYDGHIIQTYTTHPDTYTSTTLIYFEKDDVRGFRSDVWCDEVPVKSDIVPVTITYNKYDQPTYMVYSFTDKNDVAHTYIVEASYNDSGVLLEEKSTYDGRLRKSYSYNDYGDITRSYFPNDGDDTEYSYIYDSYGNKIYEKETRTGDPHTYETYYSYTYNDKGDITKMVTSTSYNTITEEYSYVYYESGNRYYCKMTGDNGTEGETYYNDDASHSVISSRWSSEYSDNSSDTIDLLFDSKSARSLRVLPSFY